MEKVEKLSVQFENEGSTHHSQENMAIFSEISNCNQLNLREDLQKLIIEHNISRITSNELLNILRKHGYTELPNEMDVTKYSSFLESARKSAGANYYTTNEDRLNCGKRQRSLNSRYSSEEEEIDPSRSAKRKAVNSNTLANNDKDINENDAKNEIAPSQSYCQKRNNYSKQQQDIQFIEIPDIPVYEDLASSSDEMQVDSNIKKYLKQIIRTQDTSNLILHDLNQRISRIEDIMRGHAPISMKDNSRIKEDIMRNFVHVSIKNDNPINPITEILPLQTVESIRDDSLIVETLPLQTVEQIRDFDLLLQENDEAVTQFKAFLLKIGGSNPRRNVCRILSKIFTNNCAMKCSWKGIRNNFKVSNLYFIRIMKREVTLHYSLTEAEFDNIVAEWLRFAKQRKQREEKGKDPGHEHPEGINDEEINLLKASTA
ncbi:Dynein regulatory complex subunit 2 [Camponotus japonicus]